MRMNRVVVARAAAGIAAWLSERAEAERWGAPRAVIGYDARTKSDVFARDTAGIFTAADFDTFLMPLPLPTPILAWAVRLLSANVGIMVTASHNPSRDNGYKVYLGGRAVEEEAAGAQIVPPVDRLIAEKIAQAPPFPQIPRAESGWTTLPERFARDYEHEVCRLLPGMAPASRSLSIVLTPMHGVGGEVASMVLSRAGFDQLHIVPRQALPDPQFPTVDFPNPEEPGALDLAYELARERSADLVIAHDPDADRAAFAIPDQQTEAGWRMLRGDEVGVLLGQLMLERLPHTSLEGQKPPVFANSIVSSRLLASLARAHGIDHHQTLTGFKWISRVPGLVYGYEEALGYCVAPEMVKDKDGISAALLMADYADRLHASGRSLQDVLDELAIAHGVHAADQLSVRVQELPMISRMMDRLREQTPRELAGSEVVELSDLAEGYAGLPPTEGLLLLTEESTRVIIRPSGTEPKLKCYLEVIEPVNGSADLVRARHDAAARLATVRAELAALLGVPA